MIDVGCGEGFAINHFHSNGYLVKGLDFSEAGVKIITHIYLAISRREIYLNP